MPPQGGLLSCTTGALVLALVGAAFLQERIEHQRIARLDRAQHSLFGAFHRGWNFTTARPSAVCRGSGFQAWP